MFRVKTLFSTVSISNSNYCLTIFTLPGNWAMLENKLHIWSLFGALLAGSGECGEKRIESANSSLTQPTANKRWGNLEVMKVDFFALLYIVKKERIMYIEILFWIKKNVYNDKEFC